ncbi:acetyl-coenzyme A synthetase N-terminal domain-containing protein [Mycobacterium sp. 3519A]
MSSSFLFSDNELGAIDDRRLSWHQPLDQILVWSDAPYARWFADGTLNVA